MKKIFIVFAILIMHYCYAIQIYTDLPKGFPSTMPNVSNHVALSTTHVFFKKWAESIRGSQKEVELKIYDRNFEGVGVNQNSLDEFLYFPSIIIDAKPNSISCRLYQGLVNQNMYH